MLEFSYIQLAEPLSFSAAHPFTFVSVLFYILITIFSVLKKNSFNKTRKYEVFKNMY